jgi:hypothetical protein
MRCSLSRDPYWAGSRICAIRAGASCEKLFLVQVPRQGRKLPSVALLRQLPSAQRLACP